MIRAENGAAEDLAGAQIEQRFIRFGKWAPRDGDRRQLTAAHQRHDLLSLFQIADEIADISARARTFPNSANRTIRARPIYANSRSTWMP